MLPRLLAFAMLAVPAAVAPLLPAPEPVRVVARACTTDADCERRFGPPAESDLPLASAE